MPMKKKGPSSKLCSYAPLTMPSEHSVFISLYRIAVA